LFQYFLKIRNCLGRPFEKSSLDRLLSQAPGSKLTIGPSYWQLPGSEPTECVRRMKVMPFGAQPSATALQWCCGTVKAGGAVLPSE
jgi:hypothetical protein